MRLLNNLIKSIALFGVHLAVLLQCYFLSILCTGCILSIVMAVMSIFTEVNVLTCGYPFWIVLLVCSIPFMLIFFILVELDLVKIKK